MNRSWTRKLIAAVGLSAVLAVTAACGDGGDGDDKATTAGGASASGRPAGDGGNLVIYSGRNEKLVGPILAKLEAATGVKVEVRYGDSAELAAQILEEGDKTRAGLFFSQDAGALGALSAKGRLEPLPAAVVGTVDPAYRAADGTWTGVSGRARVLAYHPGKLPEPPKSVRELTDPRFKGQVGYAPTNASFHAFVTALRVIDGEDAAKNWLKAMKDNGIKAYKSNNEVLDAVDRGEVSVGLINHYYWYAKAAEKGASNITAKLNFLPAGDPGGLINVAGVGVLKGTKQSAAAVKAVEYLLSADAQKYFADSTKEYPLAAGVPSGVEGLPALNTLEAPKIDLGRLESLSKTLALLQDVGMV